MKNLAEFKKLIQCYETITLKEIKEAWVEKKGETANKLTGFGSSNTCPLCSNNGAGSILCRDCIWGFDFWEGCASGDNANTYKAIKYADTPEELLQAFRNRAKRMREKLMELGINY